MPKHVRSAKYYSILDHIRSDVGCHLLQANFCPTLLAVQNDNSRPVVLKGLVADDLEAPSNGGIPINDGCY
eukprot:10863062-Ditylum_brightwellii.AAC.1